MTADKASNGTIILVNAADNPVAPTLAASAPAAPASIAGPAAEAASPTAPAAFNPDANSLPPLSALKASFKSLTP